MRNESTQCTASESYNFEKIKIEKQKTKIRLPGRMIYVVILAKLRKLRLEIDANLFRNTVRSTPGWLRSRHRSVNFGSSIDRLFVDPHGAKRTYLRRDELSGSDASEFWPRWILHSHGTAVFLSVHRYTQ